MTMKIFLVSLLGLFTVGAFASNSDLNLQMKYSPIKIVDSSTAINGPIYIVENGQLESLDYPNLEYLNGPIYIVANSNLKTVRFPKLKYVNGPIYVSYNAALEVAQFSSEMYVNGPIYYYMNKINK